MSDTYVSKNFIEQIIEEDLSDGVAKEVLRFRFPPEPNGYLHIGHTKAIGISFGLGQQYDAPVNLRFDDTNPAKEEQEYVDAIRKDIKWLGYTWDKECYSSDYFQQLYDWAVDLIKKGKAYVDSQSSEAMAEQKGTPTEVGTNSPYRDRSVDENLQLFREMKEGKHPEGTHVLRAKIDMASPNMLLRDPLMYRIINKEHHRTGSDWCIYPMYDWAHGQSDFVEQISHSLCSLEFKPHRDLYNWFLEQIDTNDKLVPKQREFARLNLSYTVMSKRKLLELVETGVVKGWDDPRMPTISGLRRRGYTPASIRNFVDTVGVAKRENVIDVSLLEYCVREDLNKKAVRVMVVMDPVKLVITNYPEDKVEWLDAENNPEDITMGHREIPFSRELYIEREDFREEANRKFFRLSIGKEVRLKNAYIIKGEKVVKDENGNITEIHATCNLDSRSGTGTEASKRQVKGTLHWVSIKHAIHVEVRMYDRLFNDEAPDSHKDKDFKEFLNPDSLQVQMAYAEVNLRRAKLGQHLQFMRKGYFTVDPDSYHGYVIFNKTVGLRDTWAKVSAQQTPKEKKANTAPKATIAPLQEIQKLGKKFASLPLEKQTSQTELIRQLATKITYEEIQPLLKTSVKKTGTRLVTAIVLLEKRKNNEVDNTGEIQDFIQSTLEDKNELLREYGQSLQERF